MTVAKPDQAWTHGGVGTGIGETFYTSYKTVQGVDRVWYAVDQLPNDPEIAPLKAEIELGIRRIESRIAEADRNSSRTGKRLFMFGLILGVPLGVAGSYIAYLLGIN